MDTIKVVCGIIYNDNKVLICRRKSSKLLGGFWEFPGGKVEKGESNEWALIRELREELGMKVKNITFFGTNIHEYISFKIELQAYKCKFIKTDLILKDHDTIEWINIQDIGSYDLAQADIPIAKELMLELKTK